MNSEEIKTTEKLIYPVDKNKSTKITFYDPELSMK